jgi:putative NADPH-quinone reductase/1,4-dihydroxy-2-naphthoate octaprenyltransferase
MNVLLIFCHPRKDSLNGALYQAFREGVLEAGVAFHELVLADLQFDPDVHEESPAAQHFEEAISEAQELISQADHLVFVYPTWWGSYPARLKGFLDRVLTPGFAFQYLPDGNGWEQRLRGKTAQLLTTMDTPHWVYRWIYKNPGYNTLARATLGFCGIRTVRKTIFGPVISSTAEQRRHWLQQARQEGLRLRDGARSARQRATDKILAWLQALRLQFYPMTLIAYSVGALAVAQHPQSFDNRLFWLGYAALFFLEVATVLANDYFDYESDRQNRHAGPFTGGSRVLVDGKLSFREVRYGIVLAFGVFILLSVYLISVAGAALPLTVNLLVLALLAMGYTVPPLKFSHRGLGELVVAVTHSSGVILPGYLLQGGSWHDPLPWLLSLPLGLAVLPAIILSGIPDYDADRDTGKNTLVVKLGIRGALIAAIPLAILAALLAVIWQQWDGIAGAYGSWIYIVVPYAAWLVWKLGKYLHQVRVAQRINTLMVLALSFIIWFGVIPLIRLW